MTETLPVASIRDTLRTVRGLLARRRGPITATVALLLTGSASALAIPPVLGWIVDIILSGVDVWRIPFAAGVLQVPHLGIEASYLLSGGGAGIADQHRGSLQITSI